MELQNIVTRLFKYLLEGLAVAAATVLMTRRQATYREIAIIAGSAALTFFLLDTLAPSIAFGARKGTGFGIGVQGVGIETFTDEITTTSGAPVVGTVGVAEAEEVLSTGVTSGVVVNDVIVNGGCDISSPFFKEGPDNCKCVLDCNPACPNELTCPVTCPIGKTVFQNCNIESNNSPYKIVPGQYSHQVVLPGYNECVKPYNYYANN